MPRTIRFHLDENCSKAIAGGLRRRGIRVTTTPEAGLMGAIDEHQAAYSLALSYVLGFFKETTYQMAGSTFQTNPIDLNTLLEDCHRGVLQ